MLNLKEDSRLRNALQDVGKYIVSGAELHIDNGTNTTRIVQPRNRWVPSRFTDIGSHLLGEIVSLIQKISFNHFHP